MPDGIDENFTIRLLAHPVNAEMRSSFDGHHISASSELRVGGVKAEARRVERSESLDDVEHSSILIVVMADFWRERTPRTPVRSTAGFATDLWRVRK
jgi:hypothetical protein